jgi:hypothetical protein
VHPDVPFFVLLADDVDGCFDPSQERFQLVRRSALTSRSWNGSGFIALSSPSRMHASTPCLLAAPGL